MEHIILSFLLSLILLSLFFLYISDVFGRKQTIILSTIFCFIGYILFSFYSGFLIFLIAEIMIGIGNLTELTHADTAGMNALLFGIASELEINYALCSQVSEHCNKAIIEGNFARRITGL